VHDREGFARTLKKIWFLTGGQGVAGSNPVILTIFLNVFACFGIFEKMISVLHTI